MRRFRFGLERVRKLRKHRERAARLELGRELFQLAAATEHRKRVEENIAVCLEQTAGGHLDPFAAALEVGLTAILGRVEQKIELAETNVAQAREFYQERRQDLLATIRKGSVVAWQHINLHGEYDFAAEKLQDSVGLEVPKIRHLELG